MAIRRLGSCPGFARFAVARDLATRPSLQHRFVDHRVVVPRLHPWSLCAAARGGCREGHRGLPHQGMSAGESSGQQPARPPPAAPGTGPAVSGAQTVPMEVHIPHTGQTVPLPPRGHALVLGRGADTGICAKACSRQQARLLHRDDGSVELEQVGPNPCAVAGRATQPGARVTLQPDAAFSLLASCMEDTRCLLRQAASAAPAAAVGASEAPAAPGDAQGRKDASKVRRVGPDPAPKRRMHPMFTPKPRGRDAVGSRRPAAQIHTGMDGGASCMRLNGAVVPLPPGWGCHGDSVLHRQFGSAPPSELVAAFDFDGCLAVTSLGGTDPNAWRLKHPGTVTVLSEYAAKGYKLVIFSNESLARYKKTEVIGNHVVKKTSRLAAFVAATGLPWQVFTMVQKNEYRKPGRRAWDHFVQEHNGGRPIDLTRSFYVGDAAGRPRDHSRSDLEFAQNVGVEFFTDEQFFRGT